MRCDVTVSHTFAISQPCCIAEWHWPQPWIDCGVRTGRRYGVPAPWPMHCCECVVTLSGLVPAVVHMISDRVGCGVLRVPVGSLRVTKRSTVTCLRIYGFTPLPPPLAGRPADAHLLIKSSPGRRSQYTRHALHARIVEHGRDLCAAAKVLPARTTCSRYGLLCADMGHARWPRGSDVRGPKIHNSTKDEQNGLI